MRHPRCKNCHAAIIPPREGSYEHMRFQWVAPWGSTGHGFCYPHDGSGFQRALEGLPKLRHEPEDPFITLMREEAK